MQSKTIKWGILFLVATVIALLVAGLIDWVFVAGHRRVGSAASNSLAREYVKHPGVVALALEARCRTGEYPEAQKLIQEIGTPVRSAVLRQAIAHCEQDFTFARAEHLLQQGLAPGAIRLMSPWYPTGPDPYRAGVILMRANLVEHHFNRALKLGSALSARYPGDPTLAHLIHELKARVTLDRAQAALASGHAGEAIRLAAPVWQKGPDFYRAGLILARADLALHHLRHAGAVYAALARRYPKDRGLVEQADRIRTSSLLTAAQTALAKGRPIQAIHRLRTLYPSGTRTYRAALILARAYASEHRFHRASRMYHALEKRYPKDRSFATALVNLRTQETLSLARAELAAHEPRRAIRTLRPLYRSGRDPYDSGILLAQAEVALHHFAAARRIDRALARQYPKDRSFATALVNLHTQETLSLARAELAAHEPRRAIRTLRPLYRSGRDPYDSGILLAQAYAALGQKAREARIYAQLSAHYPKDPGLAVAAVVTHVQAGRSGMARSELANLNPQEQALVWGSLGPGVTRLYRHFVTLDGGVADSTGAYPSDNLFGIQAGFPLVGGTLVASAQRIHRFGETAESYSLDDYTALGSGFSGEFSVGYSPNNTILADESFGVALSKSVGALSLDVRVRHLIFSNAVANVLFGGVGFYPARNLHLETGLYYVPETNAYSILVAPEWFHGGINKTYLYLTAGEAGEQLIVQNAILRTPSYGVTLGEVFELTHQLSLNVAIFDEHRSGLYDRRGLYVSLTRRW